MKPTPRFAPRPSPTYTDEDALTDGRWVSVRGVQRWVPDEVPLIPVACEDCGARASDPCRADTGKARRPHLGRVMRCACGATRHPDRTYCDDCHPQVRRIAWRGASRRKRAS